MTLNKHWITEMCIHNTVIIPKKFNYFSKFYVNKTQDKEGEFYLVDIRKYCGHITVSDESLSVII